MKIKKTGKNWIEIKSTENDIASKNLHFPHSKVVPREIDKADYLYIFSTTAKLLYAMKYVYINPV